MSALFEGVNLQIIVSRTKHERLFLKYPIGFIIKKSAGYRFLLASTILNSVNSGCQYTQLCIHIITVLHINNIDRLFNFFLQSEKFPYYLNTLLCVCGISRYNLGIISVPIKSNMCFGLNLFNSGFCISFWISLL